MRSGSAITHSAPVASISARRASVRVVARTAWPCSRSCAASSSARQPPPTTSARAKSDAPDLGLVFLARKRGQPALGAALVLEREQLVDLLVGEVGVVAL